MMLLSASYFAYDYDLGVYMSGVAVLVFVIPPYHRSFAGVEEEGEVV